MKGRIIMKKSKLYYLAMVAVIDAAMSVEERLKVLEVLMADKQTEEFCEEREKEVQA